MELEQYSVVIVKLDPTKGSEIQKTRPCLVISPIEMNQYLKTVIVAPITSNLNRVVFRTGIDLDGKKGMIALDQVRAIDKSRIVNKMNYSLPRIINDKVKTKLLNIFI